MIDRFIDSLPHMLPLSLIAKSLQTFTDYVIVGVVIGTATGILAARFIHKGFSHVYSYGPTLVGGIGVGYMLFVRIIASVSMLLVAGKGALALASIISMAALPWDILSARRLRRSFRNGLAALILMLNIPLTAVYPVHLAMMSASAVAGRRGASAARQGIQLGRGLYALFIGPMEVQNRHGDVVSVRRDEEQLIKLGSYPIFWSPEGGNGELNPHIVITGRSGAGKSTLVYRLILELLERGHGVTVIDMTGQYALLAKWLIGAISRPPQKEVVENRKIRYVRDEEFSKVYDTELERVVGRRFQKKPPRERAVLEKKFVVLNVVERGVNAFSPVAGEPYLIMAEDLSYAISVVERTSLGANQHYYLIASAQKECERALREGRAPRISGVAEVLNDMMSTLDPRERDTFQAVRSLQRRLDLLALYLEPNGVPITPLEMEAKASEEEWGQLVVLDLSSIHDEDTKAIAAELILRKLAHYIESGKRPMAPSKRWFIVVDEAWRLLKPSDDAAHRTKLEWLYRVGRNWNVGIIALTQLWSDLGKIASNADLQIHLNIADSETVEELVEYTGLQTLRRLGAQLPRHAALILNRSTQDDLENLAAATLYQGRAKIWVVAEMQRLYLPKGQVALVQAGLGKEKEKVTARLQELSVRIIRTRTAVVTAGGSSHSVPAAGSSQVKKVQGGVPTEDEAEIPKWDPLEEVISALRSSYHGNYRREEVLAACLIIAGGAFSNGCLDLSRVGESVRRRLKLIGVYNPDSGFESPRPAFQRLVGRVASLGKFKIDAVVKLTCPNCLAYPATPSHVCSSSSGGVPRELRRHG